ncbi:MAG TPA: hypothetical protein VNU93_03965 [Verrucomicrobiae bacterium]|nr:hypothetical protein [Verrucomicrobiae bacterium]
MEEYPKNLAEIIGSGSRVIITIATAGTDKRVRLGRIIEYDALNKLISVQQEDRTICLVPLASISSIEVLRNNSNLGMIKKLVKEK